MMNRSHKPAQLAEPEKHSSPGRHRGTAATEFALILPLLVTILLGFFDLGRAVHNDIILSNAARVGAEYGATHKFTAYTRNFWESQVRQSVIEELQQTNDFDTSLLQIDVQTVDEGVDLPLVKVEVTYPFESVVSWPGICVFSPTL